MAKKEIWVYAESLNGHPAPVYYELLSKAEDLAATLGWGIAAVVIGSRTDAIVEELKATCDTIYVADHLKLQHYTTELYASAFEKMIKDYAPEMLLIGASDTGSELAPTVAARVKTGLAAHCIDIRIDKKNDRINCMVPAFGGRVVSEIYIPETRPIMASIRPGILDRSDVAHECGDVKHIDTAHLDAVAAKEEFLEFTPHIQKGVKLEEANVVVAAGRGVSSEQAWNELTTLAEKLGGAIAWSRSFIDLGFVDSESNMLGTSGKSVKPQIFIGAGISGATHFICGMNKSKVIISVNRDENAKMFENSDYGVVGDAKKFLEALNKKFS